MHHFPIARLRLLPNSFIFFPNYVNLPAKGNYIPEFYQKIANPPDYDAILPDQTQKIKCRKKGAGLFAPPQNILFHHDIINSSFYINFLNNILPCKNPRNGFIGHYLLPNCLLGILHADLH